MIILDYQTNNPRWGLRGMKFSSWESFGLTLGFLSNISHYQGHGQSSSLWDDSISISIEGNNEQGAWDKEGRIHYYKAMADLNSVFPDLATNSSAGRSWGNVTRRINSNGFILSLVNDFQFNLITYTGRTTADVFPPQNAYNLVKQIFQNHLMMQGIPNGQIALCSAEFDNGWNV